MIQKDEEKYKKWRNRHIKHDKKNNVAKKSHIKREDYYFTEVDDIEHVVM